MKIIIIGAPGAGKDTQARKLAKHFKLKVVSSGDILRKESRKNAIIKKYIDKGELIPSRLFYNILKKYIVNEKNLILNGFPRSKEQLKFSFCKNPDYVIFIDVPEKVVINRLRGRGKKDGRIDDKSLDTIKKRYNKYNETIRFIIDYYKKKNKLIIVNGDQSRGMVFKDIIRKIYHLPNK